MDVLNDVVVGDKITVKGQFVPKHTKVLSVTPKYVNTAFGKYRKSDGKACGNAIGDMAIKYNA